MSDTPARTTNESASPIPNIPDIPDFPMPRAARCPFDPPPAVRELTAENPIARVRIWDGSTPWIITRHADQKAILADPRVSIDEGLPGFPHMTRGRAEAAKSTPPLITNTDAPEHTRLRRMVNAPFLIKRVEARRPGIQKMVDGLIDEMLAGPNPADLVTAVGLPVPTLVICELLGVPYGDHEFFQRNSNIAINQASTEREVMEAGGALIGYLDDLIGVKLTDPTEDVMSEMAGRVKAGEMTRGEAVYMGVAMLIAGHETTANMITLGTLALLRHPEQLAVLREGDDPKVVANAVEELLRYLTIVHTGIRRIATEDIEIGGEVIRAGDGIVVELSAANWDMEVFPEPERLDLSRAARQHHAFGHGPHQCLGQSLARVELQVLFGTLYRRIPTLRLAVPAEQVEFDYSGITYGVHSLPVTW